MIQTEEQYEFAVEAHFIEYFTGGPWFNEKHCQNLHGLIFEEFFVTACQNKYDLMCGLNAYDK